MYQKLLVPVDGSPTSNRGLEEAIRLATLTHGRLRLVHVVDDLSFSLATGAYGGYSGDLLDVLRSGGSEILAQAAAKVEAAGLEVDTVLHETMTGSVSGVITREASDCGADLIVLGTHGRRGVGRMVLGSSAESVVRYAPVPVLLVRAPELKASKSGSDSESKNFLDPVRLELPPTGGLHVEKSS